MPKFKITFREGGDFRFEEEVECAAIEQHTTLVGFNDEHGLPILVLRTVDITRIERAA